MKSKPTDIRPQQTVLLKALEDSGNYYEYIESVLVENHERYLKITRGTQTSRQNRPTEVGSNYI